jgi:hypothetical protein
VLVLLPPLLPPLVHVLLVDERLDHLHTLAKLAALQLQFLPAA